MLGMIETCNCYWTKIKSQVQEYGHCKQERQWHVMIWNKVEGT